MKNHISLLESFWPQDNVDPIKIVSAGDWTMLQSLYANLVELDGPSSVRPGLAESWTQTPDGLEWKFRLRPNLKWSDGSPLTAADVAWSLNRSAVRTAHTRLSGFVESIQPIGDTEVMIRLRKLPPNFLVSLAFVDQGIVHPTALTPSGFSWDARSSGCFRVKERSSNKVELESNPYFFNRSTERPILTAATLIRASGTKADFELLAKGLADAFQSGPGQMIDSNVAGLDVNYDIFRGNPDFTFVLLFHPRLLKQDSESQLRRRQLLKTVHNIFRHANPDVELASGLRPKGLIGHVSNDLFLQLLQELPEDSVKQMSSLKIAVRSKHADRPYVLRLIDSLKSAGIEVQVSVSDDRPLASKQDYDLEVGFLGASEADPDSVWRYYNGYFGEPILSEKQLETAQFLQDEAARNEMYRSFEMTALKSAAYIPLAYTRTYIFTKKHILFDSRIAADWGLQLCRLSIR